MSLFYSLTIEARGLSIEQLRSIAVQKFGWREMSNDARDNYVEVGLEGNLTRGTSELEAHTELYTALKELNPAAQILTRWTCLEHLPYEEFGDLHLRDEVGA